MFEPAAYSSHPSRKHQEVYASASALDVSDVAAIWFTRSWRGGENALGELSAPVVDHNLGAKPWVFTRGDSPGSTNARPLTGQVAAGAGEVRLSRPAVVGRGT
jgi:hypothetical protein